MTKSELIEKSKEVFKLNPKAESLIATEDGQFFLPEAKSLALDYCRKKGVEKHILNRDSKAEAEAKAKEAAAANAAVEECKKLKAEADAKAKRKEAKEAKESSKK